jgi:predicted Zn-dependent protease
MRMTYDDGGRPRRGINMRWIIAIVIAVIAVVSYLGKKQVNPVTGEKQYVSMSVDQEKAMGLQAAPEMAHKMGGAIDPKTDPRAAMVAEVGGRLVRSSDASKSPYVGNFHFYLLNDPQTINAFALPGGQIFITAGLFDKLENEAQLAGVLGHEIGHVINRHAAEHMAKGELGGMLATAVGVGASDNRGHGQAAAVAAMMANQMLQLKFSRNDETEADNYGLRYMSQTGYDPRQMLGVMEILKKASQGGRTPEFLATHPMPESRLTEIQQKIKEMFPNGVPGELSTGRDLKG